MKMKKFAAAAMAFAIVSASAPVIGEVTPNFTITASAAETTYVDVLPSLKTLSATNATAYTNEKTATFNMSGRTYYQGIVLGKSYSSMNSEITFDVENISKLSWVNGHVDGAKRNDAKLKIYLDDNLEDSVQLSWSMTAYKYELDVSKASKVSFVLDDCDGSNYGLGDITADSDKPSITSSRTEYKNVSGMIASSYDNVNITAYQGSNKSEGFNMNGRTYYQGYALSSSYSGDIASLTLNVEGLSKISWTYGHIDEEKRNNAKLNVYVDDELTETRSLTWTMDLDECEITLPKDAKTMRIVLDTEGGCKYGIGDIKVDSLDAGVEHLVPTYSKSSAFIDSGYNMTNAKKYTGSAKGTNYNVNGRTYYQGIVLSGAYSDDSATISYNVENLSKLSFTLGRLPDSGGNYADLHIYLDDVEYDVVALAPYMAILPYELDVKDAKTVRFNLEPKGKCSYALMDVTADELAPELTYTVPTYAKINNLTDSIFNLNNQKAYAGNTKAESFNMNGRTYYEGVTLSHSYSGSTATFSMNVEDIKELSFDLGHVDNSGNGKCNVYVYLDEELIEKIPVTPTMTIERKTIDVSKGTVIRFLTDDTDGGCVYALGDLKADEREAANPHAVPEYKDAKAFIDAAYNNFYVDTFNGSSPKVNFFTMGGTEYATGLIFDDSKSVYPRYINFNVENVDTLSFKMGYVDESMVSGYKCNATVSIYKDNEIFQTVKLDASSAPEVYNIDTKDAQYVRFYVTFDGKGKFGVGDIDFKEGTPTTTTTTTKAAETTTTTTTTKSTGSITDGRLFGDLNGDGILDGRDATAMLTYYAKCSTGYAGTIEDFIEDLEIEAKGGTPEPRTTAAAAATTTTTTTAELKSVENP